MLSVFLSGCGPSDPAGSGGNTASYPSKTMTVICPWNAGGGTDRVSRFLADALKQQLGAPLWCRTRREVVAPWATPLGPMPDQMATP